MLKNISLCFFLILFISCGESVKKKEYKSPDETYGKLFEDVQLKAVFPDSKTFADGIPLYKPEDILKAYETEKKQSGFDLKVFVLKNFRFSKPDTNSVSITTDSSVANHINALWPLLTRKPKDDGGSLIPLRKEYVVPGGRFGEIYYWDSYFTMLGLQAARKDTLVENMVLNFAQLIQDFGHVPNGNRSYYLSRSQPPFFSLMVELLAEMKNDDQIYVRNTAQLLKEYQYWMAAESKEEAIKQAEAKATNHKAYRKAVFLKDDQLLNRYYDESDTPRPEAYKEDVKTALKSGRDKKEVYRHLRSGAESGWDYSTRWFKDEQNITSIHTTEIIPVDLNALLYHLEIVLAKAYRVGKQETYAKSMETLAAKRKAVFDTYFWNEQKGFYFDYDFEAGKQKDVYSLAAVYPLFIGIASPQQAEKVSRVLEKKFLMPGGLTTTLTKSGQQWDAPNGWAPLQWIAIQGLRKYQYRELANEIKYRWVQNNQRVYKNTGKLVEKYNVENVALKGGGGEYPLQDGFGWTNGVLLRLLSE